MAQASKPLFGIQNTMNSRPGGAQFRCALCHQIRGTSAGAVSAADLTHLMSRRTLAAGSSPNNPGSLAGWIQELQEVKPGSLMANQYLSAQQWTDVLAYQETLQ